MTVFELLQKEYPHLLNYWDREDYKIHGPISLDDEAVVEVTLISKEKGRSKIELPIAAKKGVVK